MHANLFVIRKKDAIATESTEFHRTVDIRNVANLKAYLPVPMAEDFRTDILCIFSISYNHCFSRVDERNKSFETKFLYI